MIRPVLLLLALLGGCVAPPAPVRQPPPRAHDARMWVAPSWRKGSPPRLGGDVAGPQARRADDASASHREAALLGFPRVTVGGSATGTGMDVDLLAIRRSLRRKCLRQIMRDLAHERWEVASRRIAEARKFLHDWNVPDPELAEAARYLQARAGLELTERLHELRPRPPW